MIKEIRAFIGNTLKNSNTLAATRLYNLLLRIKYPYSFVGMNKIALDTIDWCKSLPSEFDVVVAIPRSGMIMGSLIATYFGKPLATPEMITKGQCWMSKQSDVHKFNPRFYGTVLLVDDFVYTGQQLADTKKTDK